MPQAEAESQQEDLLGVIPVIICSPLQELVVCLVRPVLVCCNWLAQLRKRCMLPQDQQQTAPARLPAPALPLQPHPLHCWCTIATP